MIVYCKICKINNLLKYLILDVQLKSELITLLNYYRHVFFSQNICLQKRRFFLNKFLNIIVLITNF